MSKFSLRRINSYPQYLLLLISILVVVNVLLSVGIAKAVSVKSGLKLTGNEALSAPVLVIKEPRENQTISGVVPMTLAYPEGYSFSKIVFWVGGELVKELIPPSGPHQLTFDFESAAFDNGDYTLSFSVTDNSGFSQVGSVKVKVDN